VNVSELGEFALIERLAKVIDAPAPEGLIVGIGDDAAVWRTGDSLAMATTDTLVEGVHFLPGLTPWRDLGWKALAVNVSDIAAMGGAPLFALVTLAAPRQTDIAHCDELYAGLGECAREYGVTIAGGDIVRASEFSITVALIGRAEMCDGKPLLLRRDCARAGDEIAVTGCLGDSAAGLLRLKDGTPTTDSLVQAHLRPHPPLQAAQEAARLGVVCGIDISDGLTQDLGHVCQRSNLGADVRADALPISEALRSSFPEKALSLACTGGEDYQMLFTGPSDIIERLRSAAISPVTVIGKMTSAGERRAGVFDAAGEEIRFESWGWDHLRT